MKNDVRIFVKGNPTRIINKLNYLLINVYDVKSVDGGLIISVRYADREKTVVSMKAMDYECIILKNGILERIYIGFTSHLGVFAGIVAVLMIICIFSMLTFEITVTGLDNVPRSEIETVLFESGIKKFGWKVKDVGSLAEKILEDVDGLSYVNCEYNGFELRIDVKEELRGADMSKDNDGNIIANSDGIITRITVKEGTALVKANDRVRKGDILIAAYITVGEGDTEKRIECNASGKVYARTFESESVVVAETNVVNVRSGNVKKKTAVSIASLKSKVPESPFQNYDVEVETHTVYGIVPLTVKTYYFYELCEKVYSIEDSEYKDALINNAKARLNMTLTDDKKFIKSWIIEKKLDNLYIIDVYYELEELIGGGNI